MIITNQLIIKLTNITICLLICLGNAATISLGNIFKGIPVKVVEVLMIVNLILVLKYLYDNNKLKINFQYKYIFYLLFWVILGVFSALINFFIYEYKLNELVYGLLYAFRFVFYIIYTYYITIFLYKNGIGYKKTLYLIVNSYIVVCVIGIIQLLLYPNALDFYSILKELGIYILNPDPHINRIISTYLDPNFLASILVIPLNISLAFLLEKKSLFRSVIYLLFIILVQILTNSRSGLIGITFSLLIFFGLSISKISKDKKIKLNKVGLISIYLIILLVPIIIYFFGEDLTIIKRLSNIADDPSAQFRFSNWKFSINLISQNPILGIGYNMLGFYIGQSTSITSFGVDSSLFLCLITSGIVGFLIFISFFTNSIRRLSKLRKEKFFLCNAMISILLSSIIMSFFNNLLFYPLWIVPVLLILNTVIINDIKFENS